MHAQQQAIPMRMTTFPDVKAREAVESVMTWGEVVEMIRSPGTWQSKSAMPLLKLATFGEARTPHGALRHDANLREITGIEGDYDGGTVALADAATRLERAGVRAVLYTSPSHRPEAPRWRVLAPLAAPHPPSARAALVARLNGALGGILAGESFTLSQSFYMGRVDGNAYEVVVTFDDPEEGACIDELDELDELAVGRPVSAAPAATPGASGEAAAARAPLWQRAADTVARLGRKLRTGDARRELLKSYIASRSIRGLDRAEVRALVEAFIAEYFDPADLPDEANVQKIVAWACSRDEKARATSAGVGPQDGDEIDGAALLALQLPEVHYLCRPWIPEGVMIHAGRPKLGKTTMLRQFAACVAAGRDLWGAPCTQADVLFLSLEEGAKLMRKKLVLAGYEADDVRRIRFHWKWRPGVFGVGDIREKLTAHPEIRLVIIDSLTRFRETSTRDKPQFQQDYEAVAMLADVAKERPGLSIIVLHHTKKDASADDPISDISGTYGLTAAADNYMVMRRESDEYVLHCGGRYWDESDDAYRLRRDSGRWALQGTALAVKLSPMQRAYLEALNDPGTITGALTTRELARRFDVKDTTASEIARELQAKGLARRDPDGWRSVPVSTTPTTPVVVVGTAISATPSTVDAGVAG